MTLAEIILTPTLPLESWTPEFDPTVGSGSTIDEIDAPQDWDAATITFDPWVTA